jgi:hypothetical protein
LPQQGLLRWLLLLLLLLLLVQQLWCPLARLCVMPFACLLQLLHSACEACCWQQLPFLSELLQHTHCALHRPVVNWS